MTEARDTADLEPIAPARAEGSESQDVAAGPPPRERLPIGIKLAYGMPSFAGAAMAVPIAVHMTKFYSDTVGVALGFIALAQTLARAFDAITDPLMGWISDRTNTRWGRRRPWIFIGAPIASVFFVGMFAPPESLTPLEGAAWFTTMIFGFFVLNTIYGIPHYGLGPELTQDYQERNSLFAWREGCILLGTMIAAAAPSIVIPQMVAGGAEQSVAERRVYFWFAASAAVLMVLLFWWLCFRVRENPDYYTRKPNPLVPGVRRVLRNRPFRILLTCYLIGSITGAIPGIFLPYYLHYVINLENWTQHLGYGLMTYFGAGFLSVPIFWLRLMRRYGKKKVWISNFVLGMTASLSFYFIPDFWTGPDALPAIYTVLVWAGTAFGCGIVLGPSIQADVIDYDELYTGKRREAQYGALWAIMTKFAVIPSASIPLSIMASVGFEPNVEQTETVQWTIRAIYGIAPATISFAAMCIALYFPISEDVHAAILHGIQEHRQGRSARDPLTGRELPPPSSRGLDEDTGWYLDHFSRREIARAVRSGHGAFRRDAWIGVILCAAVCIGFSAFTVHLLSDLSVQPGPLAVIGVMLAGIGLTGVCYHGVRVAAAGRARLVSDADMRTHLEVSQRFAQDR